MRGYAWLCVATRGYAMRGYAMRGNDMRGNAGLCYAWQREAMLCGTTRGNALIMFVFVVDHVCLCQVWPNSFNDTNAGDVLETRLNSGGNFRFISASSARPTVSDWARLGPTGPKLKLALLA